MRKNFILLAVLLASGSLLTSCSSPATTTQTATTSDASTSTTSATNDPKSSISSQLEFIKAGDAEQLKTFLTPRVRDKVTQEVVDKAKTDAGKYTIDDLYASAEMGKADGKNTAKVKMKNGRTLTTLIETDGKWLADTIWFK